MSAAGGHNDRAEYFPSYSPDGRSIIFGSVYEASDPAQSHVDIFTMNSSGSDLKRLTSHPGNDMFPVWFRTVKTTPFLKTIGNNSRDSQPSVVRQTVDNGFIMAWHDGINKADASIVKFNTVGDVQWAKSFSGPGYNADLFKDIRQTSDGGYIAAGETSSFGGPYAILLVKLLNNGDIQWAKTIGDGILSGRLYTAESVQETPDGNYLIGGNTMTTSEKYWNAFIAKVDKNGSLLGAKTFPGIRITSKDITQQTPDGGFIIAGSQSYGDNDFIIVKLDSGGNIQWSKKVGVVGSDIAYSLQQNSDGTYTIIGNTNTVSMGNKLLIVNLDSLGNVQWTKTLGDMTYDMGSVGARSFQKTSDNGYIVIGTTRVASVAGGGLFYSKLDSSGNLQWTKLVKMPDSLNSYGVFSQQTFDGGYIITGIAQNTLGTTKTILLKTDSYGNAGACGIIQSISPAVTAQSVTAADHYLFSQSLAPPVIAQSLTLTSSSLPPSDAQCQM